MCFRVILNVTKSDSQTKAPNCFLFSLTFLNGPGVYHSESNKVLKPSVLLKVQMLDFLLLLLAAGLQWLFVYLLGAANCSTGR